MPELQQTIDPRIRRTRIALQQALERLLKGKDFEKISVQDIADEASINRVTFYDHFTDKSALLECMVSTRFEELIAERGLQYNGGCAEELSALILAICDYLASMPRVEDAQNRPEKPYMEAAVIAATRKLLIEGHRRYEKQLKKKKDLASPEMMATTVSWAIYGAAQEWLRSPNRVSSPEIVRVILPMAEAIFEACNLA